MPAVEPGNYLVDRRKGSHQMSTPLEAADVQSKILSLLICVPASTDPQGDPMGSSSFARRETQRPVAVVCSSGVLGVVLFKGQNSACFWFYLVPPRGPTGPSNATSARSTCPSAHVRACVRAYARTPTHLMTLIIAPPMCFTIPWRITRRNAARSPSELFVYIFSCVICLHLS